MVFLSYAREDQKDARRIYEDLQRHGLKVWADFDKGSIAPGTRWKIAIKRAIEKNRFFLAILSSNSVTKRGFVQKELAMALELLDEFPEQDIFIIPVRLDECTPSHEKLKELQWVNMFPSWEDGINRIISVLSPEDNSIVDSEIIKGLLSENKSLILKSYARIRSQDKGKYYEEIINILRTSNPVQYRLSALMGLMVFRHKFDPTVYLIELMHDSSNAVRRRAVFYLGEIRSRKAIEIISALLSDKNPDVRAEARVAYKKITGESP